MAKRRSNGEGSITKRPDGTWMAQVSVGRDPATGKLKRKTFYGKTRQEVSKKITGVIHEIQTGNYIEPALITLGQWLNDWLKGRKPHITESTWQAYEVMIRCHINPNIGGIKLKDLRTRDIQNLLNAKLENGRVDGKGGLSTRVIKYIYSTLQSALKQAVKERLITHNVADAIELPKQKKQEMKILTKENISVFMETAKNSIHYPAFLLELSTGLRRGELIGLRWEDIDFHNGILRVKQQIVRCKKGLIISEPKTEKSKRTISLHKGILEKLKEHKKHQNELKLLLGPAYQDNGLVFCTEDGKPLDPRNFVRHFESVLKKAGLKHIRFHDMRHTFATMALQSGIPAKTIQEFLGHSTISVTMDTYSHVTPEMQSEAANIIGNILSNF